MLDIHSCQQTAQPVVMQRTRGSFPHYYSIIPHRFRIKLQYSRESLRASLYVFLASTGCARVQTESLVRSPEPDLFELTLGLNKTLRGPPDISSAISMPVKMLLAPSDRVMAAHGPVGLL